MKIKLMLCVTLFAVSCKNNIETASGLQNQAAESSVLQVNVSDELSDTLPTEKEFQFETPQSKITVDLNWTKTQDYWSLDETNSTPIAECHVALLGFGSAQTDRFESDTTVKIRPDYSKSITFNSRYALVTAKIVVDCKKI